MPAKKFSVDQIIGKLRKHEKLQGQGLTPGRCAGDSIRDREAF